ncbi:HAD-IIB family hydrolase [Mycoplasmopsis gallopavonis]|uniref:COF family HAD hydrolase protein n=1 Tax=Mycoplasmopsis gallopavonis TaxID=76629 RepID=A0A449AZN9_9BACT|nr:HAD-IIB family hydrolase [Mycoplasmopsis gallopavonis]RIV16732.1 HAD-IIB family hydrolase [Mycoplasmopsis gallopavonis]VEU72962.1 COF family HAD hydrolase protein [Mycoplasmopsis gallopavonis]
MKKILAYDLDGTLLLKNNTVHPFTKQAIKDSHEAGYLNIVATGRGFKKIIPLIENGELANIDYFVCSNGSAIYNKINNQLQVISSLDPIAFKVMKEAANKYQSILTIDTTTYNGTILPNNKMPDWISNKQIMDLNVLNLATIEELEQIVNNPQTVITQIALRNPENLAKQITEEVRSKLDPEKFEIYLTNSIYTDANPKNASKWNGINTLLHQLGLSNKDLIAFGDSGNDVNMIEAASFGVALGNATPEAKAAANLVIDDHETGTIGETIYKIMDGQI